MGGAETRWNSVRDEAAVFQRYPEIRGLLVRDDGAGVTTGLQKLPRDFVERDGIRAGQINHAVHRFRNRDAGQGGGTSSETMGCMRAEGSRTVCRSVAELAMLPTNSKNCSPSCPRSMRFGIA
jgi:hypothetical protein